VRPFWNVHQRSGRYQPTLYMSDTDKPDTRERFDFNNVETPCRLSQFSGYSRERIRNPSCCSPNITLLQTTFWRASKGWSTSQKLTDRVRP
jgi:hypothetical protein